MLDGPERLGLALVSWRAFRLLSVPIQLSRQPDQSEVACVSYLPWGIVVLCTGERGCGTIADRQSATKPPQARKDTNRT